MHVTENWVEIRTQGFLSYKKYDVLYIYIYIYIYIWEAMKRKNGYYILLPLTSSEYISSNYITSLHL
jgi:hypothetical protein